MLALRHRLRRSYEKNSPDLLAFAAGRMPAFVFGTALTTVPVFTYHAVDESFERDLIALKKGGYRSIGAQELESVISGSASPDPRSVVITFDDGLASLTEVAAPLLEAYGFKAIAFVVTGLVPASSRHGLSGWAELSLFVKRGVLEVGAHSMYHNQVPVSTRVLGYVTPDTSLDFAANIPVPRFGGTETIRPGRPILEAAPRYTATRAFLPDPDAMRQFEITVEHDGDPAEFFRRADWQVRLRRTTPITGRYESSEESDHAVALDVSQSIKCLTTECPNPAVRHVCYPWYAGDDRTDRLARAGGAEVVYAGVNSPVRVRDPVYPHRVQRLGASYLWRLPGPERISIAGLLVRQIKSWRTSPLFSGPSRV